MAPEEDARPLSSYELLNLAENHLRLRNYSLSRQYALESLHADDADGDGSGFRDRAQQVVAASDVLSAASETEHNCYSVLGVDTFCSGYAPTSTPLPPPASHVRYGPNRYGKMLMHTHPSHAMPNDGFDLQDDSDQYHPDYGFVSQGACTGGPGLECHFEADVQFLEKDGEIFLEMPSGSAAED